jgi:hypothetical protein
MKTEEINGFPEWKHISNENLTVLSLDTGRRKCYLKIDQ